MGLVWLGHHEFLDRPVAVKFMLGAAVDRDDPRYQVFLAGARAASQVRNLAMTAVLHADLVGGVPYLVMEYVSGPTLAEILERTGPLRIGTMLAVVERVADALQALHDAGVVHRDIKPSNILIDDAGHAFLTDFGLTCIAGARSALSACGTPAYMAPELFEGEASFRTDVYALAMTVYQMLTGQPPYSGTMMEMRAGHRAGVLPMETLRNRGVPAAMIEVIQRGAAAEPIQRTKSARKFLESLRESAGDTVLGASAGAAGAGVDQLAKLVAMVRMRGDEDGGETLSTPAPGPEPVTLRVSVPCKTCGYDLKGLMIAVDCPECRTPIEQSLDPMRLLFADAAFLSRLGRGLGWLAIGNAALLLLYPLVYASHAAFGEPMGRNLWAALVAIASVVILGPGYRLAAVVEPGNPDPARFRPPARHWLVVVAGVIFAAAAWHLAELGRGRIAADQVGASGFALMVAEVAMVVWLVPDLAVRVSKLLRRAPRERRSVVHVAATAMYVFAAALGVLQLAAMSATKVRGYGSVWDAATAMFILVGLTLIPGAVCFGALWRAMRIVERIRVDPPMPAGAGVERQAPSSKGSTYYEGLRTFADRRRGSTSEPGGPNESGDPPAAPPS
jgi:hypothetical protein